MEKQKAKEWKEGEIILTFKLKKIIGEQTPLMQEWWNATLPTLTTTEQEIFDTNIKSAIRNINGWSEEDLKMRFISPILSLGKMLEDGNFASCFDKKISGEVENHHLVVKADFVMGSGLMDYLIRPYFHFQEYKPQKNPTGDPMAQILEAFLIGQVENQKESKEIPLYGCEIIGKNWTFVIMEGKEYCVADTLISTDRNDLMKIVAMLRKFREILETRLMLI